MTNDELKSKRFGIIEKVFSWLISAASLIISIVSLVHSEGDLGWIVVLGIIVFQNIFIAFVSAFETLVYKKCKEIENKTMVKYDTKYNELVNKNQEVKQTLTIRQNREDELRYFYKNIVMILNKSSSRLLEISYNFTKSCTFGSDSTDDIRDSNPNEHLKNLMSGAKDIYQKDTMTAFDDFLLNMTNTLKTVLDLYLEEKGVLVGSSISVKQFNRIMADPQNHNDIRIITTYRDNQTYIRGKRETNKEIYCIDKNSDFLYCLSNPYFLKNNMTENDNTYDNEHKGYLDFYNCTIVAPIKCEYPECTHIYGYLTCDILNDNFSIKDPLDDRMATIIETVANVIGLYFDDIDYQWSLNCGDDFLESIFKLKTQSQKYYVK